MDGTDPLTSALWTSLGALVPVLPPPRVVPALQRALRDLLAEEPQRAGLLRAAERKVPQAINGAHKPVARRQRNHRAGNLDAWKPLRSQLLATLAARQMSRKQLAAAAGIDHHAIRWSMCPSGKSPSRAAVAKLERWLASAQTHENGADDNGHARQAKPSAYTLNAAEREQLAAWRQLDEQTARAQAGVTLEIIDQAVAGQHLAPEIVARLASFLEHKTAAPAPHPA